MNLLDPSTTKSIEFNVIVQTNNLPVTLSLLSPVLGSELIKIVVLARLHPAHP